MKFSKFILKAEQRVLFGSNACLCFQDGLLCSEIGHKQREVLQGLLIQLGDDRPSFLVFPKFLAKLGVQELGYKAGIRLRRVNGYLDIILWFYLQILEGLDELAGANERDENDVVQLRKSETAPEATKVDSGR